VPVDRALTPTTGNTSSGLPVDFDMPVIEGDDGAAKTLKTNPAGKSMMPTSPNFYPTPSLER
jgi:hypothetical protein